MSAEPVYESSPIKRNRRTKSELEDLKQALVNIVAESHPCTVRQVYYLAVSAGLIEKTEQAYGNDVQRLLAILRNEGRIPYSHIVDNTRWMRKPKSYDSIADLMDRTASMYRRNIWQDADAYVEVWCEKDALSGVLYSETSTYDVPLMVSRGFASRSFLHEAAQTIIYEGKPAYLYYFGDHDPSGVVIDRKIEETIREFAPHVEIHFERVAVLPHQIENLGLPTRPTKKSDKRCKNFEGESVEVDAIPPLVLRDMVSDCIEDHIDTSILENEKQTERLERECLRKMAENVRNCK